MRLRYIALLEVFFLYFVIIPVSIIFLGYLVYIVVELIKEIKKK